MNIKNKTYKSIVSGIGASLPQEVVTNKDLSMRMDTSEEWIEERTGIKEIPLSLRINIAKAIN